MDQAAGEVVDVIAELLGCFEHFCALLQKRLAPSVKVCDTVEHKMPANSTICCALTNDLLGFISGIAWLKIGRSLAASQALQKCATHYL